LALRGPARSINGGVECITLDNNNLTYSPYDRFIGRATTNSFTLRGNNILFSNDLKGKSVNISFTASPLIPVPLSDCKVISGVYNNTLSFTGTLQLASTYAIITALGDIIEARAILSSANSTSISLVSLSEAPIVGDYICPAGSTCILPIPDSYKGALAQFTAYDIFKSLGDFESAKSSFDNGAQVLQNLQKLVNNRSEGPVLKIKQGLFGRRR